MKEAFKMDLIGANEIEQILKKLPATVQAKTLRSFNREAVKPVLKEMRNNAPVGNDELYNDIKIRNDKEDKTAVYVGAGKDEGYKVRWFEYGTVQRQTKKGFNRGVFKKKPFVQKSIDATIDQVMKFAKERLAERINTYLERQIKAVNKKLNK